MKANTQLVVGGGGSTGSSFGYSCPGDRIGSGIRVRHDPVGIISLALGCSDISYVPQ